MKFSSTVHPKFAKLGLLLQIFFLNVYINMTNIG